jgi:hypothetical protein
MLNNFKTALNWNLINALGWHTKRKIVVIECDDWGSIRSHKKAWDELSLNKQIKNDYFLKYDALESESDLLALYDTLSKFKDINGNYPIITANTLMTNPDFKKIKDDKFEVYHYELFKETLARYYPNQNTFETWEKGIDENFLKPQFHGREHVNVNAWMNALQNNDPLVKSAFDLEVFGASRSNTINRRANYMATFDFNTQTELQDVLANLECGLKIFKNTFGSHSKTIIAPCHVWSNDIDKILLEHNVLGYQANPVQFNPVIGRKKYQRKIHYTGQTGPSGLKYMIRNAFFEPSRYGEATAAKDIFSHAESAFRLNKPLVIGTHRVNFMGGIDVKNRTDNLTLFENILKELLNLYPNIEFMTSDQLIELMISEN